MPREERGASDLAQDPGIRVERQGTQESVRKRYFSSGVPARLCREGFWKENSFLLSVGRQRLGLTAGCILDNSILENSQEVGFTKHIDFEQDREKQTLFLKSPFLFFREIMLCS